MLGLILLYVGIVLISNGIARISHVDRKSLAVLNLFVGGLSLICNLVVIILGVINHNHADFYNAATGLLFGFTYLYIGINNVFHLDQRLYGWYCLFVAINTVPAGLYCLTNGGIHNPYDIAMAIIWWLWGALWITGWIETVLNKPLGNTMGYLTVLGGVVTAWIPGMMMLFGYWH